MCYHVSVGQGVRLDYQGSPRYGLNEQFSCCVGTGMENPALYGDGMYYQAGEKWWVNFYAPSTADWAEKGARLETATDMPEGQTVKLTLTLKAPQSFTLALRRPAWTTAAFEIKINGESFAIPAIPHPTDASTAMLPPSIYVEISRTWKTGDTVELTIPKNLRLEPTPDDPALAAILWGPLVLVQDMGTLAPKRGSSEGRGPAVADNPVLVASTRTVSDWLKPVSGQSGKFRTEGAGRIASSPSTALELNFIPLYRLHDHTYSIYMNLYTPDAWARLTAGAQ